jgi:hypothetical protein
MKTVGHVTHAGDKRNPYRDFIGKSKKRVCLKDLDVDWRLIFKLDLINRKEGSGLYLSCTA